VLLHGRCAADCLGGELLADAGNFSSPGYPASLPIYQVFCEWKIEGPSWHQIQLSFHVVDLPSRSSTRGHRRHALSYVAFGDFDAFGRRVEYRRLYGGHKSVRPFTAAGNSAWVTLLSTGDPHRRHRGLLIEVIYLHYGQMSFFALQVRCCDHNSPART